MAKIYRCLVNELGVLWVLSIASITGAVPCDDVISVTLPSSYSVHSGQDVTLQCTFTPMSGDVSRYQVRWQRNAQEYEVEFTSGRITSVLQPAWNGRLSFQSPASLVIAGVTAADSGAYTCGVMITFTDPALCDKANTRYFTKSTILSVLVPVAGVSVTRSRATGHDVTMGDTAYLSCITASGTTPITYTWLLNNTPLQQSGRELTISNIQPNQAGPYRCNASNTISWQQSGTFTFNVLLPVKGVSVARSRATGHDVTMGDTAYLSCITASGTTPITYTWLLNNTPLQQTGRELTISNIQPNQTGPYRCNVSNSISWQQSGTFTFNVLLPVKGVSVARSRATGHDVTMGDTAYLSCITTSGTTPITYIWLLNNTPLQQTGRELTISNIQPNQAGPYSCNVSNSISWQQSATFTFNVLLPVKGVSVARSRATGHDVTMGDTAYLICITASGTTPIAYTWLLNNTPLQQTGRELTITNIQPNQEGPYSCNVSNSISWQQSATFTFNVLLPVRGVSVTRSRATGHDVTMGDTAYLICITASGSTPITYTWFMNNTPLQQTGRELTISRYTTKPSRTIQL
ncbi:pregnancy-specific beta-1-glycoprotein 8 [Lingula anatina]|uniref:Pregnancy-specific beta-1-glycoprotein 8 n=1 Tax=Lingula anatina TaxID=7574 RepID=A0A1S3HVY7_LINAN|nr:pregnancy-specific beta-1-glycoprotein 8 [Lingula anatina]|eukprot:XP_013390183.1 pregnancy-specific beta-1-glycoprotein 8 [Lingula anatina]